MRTESNWEGRLERSEKPQGLVQLDWRRGVELTGGSTKLFSLFFSSGTELLGVGLSVDLSVCGKF